MNKSSGCSSTGDGACGRRVVGVKQVTPCFGRLTTEIGVSIYGGTLVYLVDVIEKGGITYYGHLVLRILSSILHPHPLPLHNNAPLSRRSKKQGNLVLSRSVLSWISRRRGGFTNVRLRIFRVDEKRYQYDMNESQKRALEVLVGRWKWKGGERDRRW
ncbi:hypothetical protein BDQ17DRAFT_644797 [Cyathus striatus]|nr:hypothetical protein BDQ17DRAFT_644797 [Cyathus striatus]